MARTDKQDESRINLRIGDTVYVDNDFLMKQTSLRVGESCLAKILEMDAAGNFQIKLEENGEKFWIVAKLLEHRNRQKAKIVDWYEDNA
jgi:hypothetical protein